MFVESVFGLVKQLKLDSTVVHVRESCDLGYEDRETAERCEDFCTRTGTCSVEITRKAVYVPDPFRKL
jgi:hypothetical protein